VSAPSNALSAVETLVRPADLGGAVEIAVATPAHRAFGARQAATLGICLKQGPAHTVRAEGRALAYPTDSVCVRAPGCVWSSGDTGPTGFVSIDIAASALPDEQRGRAMSFVASGVLGDVAAAARLLASRASRLAKDVAIAELVSAVWSQGLVDWPALADRPPPPLLRRARAFLDEAVFDSPSLDDVAAAARLNKHVLVRRFREHFGTTPHAYLVMAKVERARDLLARGRAAGEVAQRLGFADQAHLTRTFRSAVGIGPAAYQRRVRATG
jgi:AraC-like DNA-binding protein